LEELTNKRKNKIERKKNIENNEKKETKIFKKYNRTKFYLKII